MPWTSACLLTLAALAIGQALHTNNGFLHDRALALLIVALGLVAGAMPAARRDMSGARSAHAVLSWLLLGGVLVQVAQLLSAPPLLYAPVRHGWSDPMLAGALAATGVLALVIAAASARLRLLAFAGILAAHTIAGVWVIRTVPSPRIDVVTVNHAALDAVAAGKSPYSITFPNIYGRGADFYAEGLSTDSEVLHGLPYPPLTLAFIAPAHWMLGDYRYALVAALAAAALLIGSIGWTRHAMLVATLLLTTPRILFEIEQGWTEPFVVFLLALTAAILSRAPAKGAIALGLTMAAKQYMALALVLLPLLPGAVDTPPRKRVLLALVAAGAVTLPFVIWDPRGFMNSVVLLQLHEPFRADSLSVLAWFARRGVHVPGMAATLAAGAVATVLALRTLPRSTAGFATAIALVTFAMFLFGKKAFCNYYFFVLGALVVAIAASGEDAASTA